MMNVEAIVSNVAAKLRAVFPEGCPSASTVELLTDSILSWDDRYRRMDNGQRQRMRADVLRRVKQELNRKAI